LDELIKAFDYKRIGKSPAVFDYVKLRWMNGEYIKAMDFDKFYNEAKPYLEQAIGNDLDNEKIAGMVKTRIELYSDIPDMVSFFGELPNYDVSIHTHKKMKTNPETALIVLKEILPVVESIDDYTNDNLYNEIKKFIEEKGYKNGYVLWPLRIALTGREMTPCGATEAMEILGKEESIKRINVGISMLEK